MGVGFLSEMMKMFCNYWQRLNNSVKILKTIESYTLNG